MTPKEKAKTLIDMFIDGDTVCLGSVKTAKECALIVVDEVLNELVPSDFKDNDKFSDLHNYWYSVKAEIKNL